MTSDKEQFEISFDLTIRFQNFRPLDMSTRQRPEKRIRNVKFKVTVNAEVSEELFRKKEIKYSGADYSSTRSTKFHGSIFDETVWSKYFHSILLNDDYKLYDYRRLGLGEDIDCLTSLEANAEKFLHNWFPEEKSITLSSVKAQALDDSFFGEENKLRAWVIPFGGLLIVATCGIPVLIAGGVEAFFQADLSFYWIWCVGSIFGVPFAYLWLLAHVIPDRLSGRTELKPVTFEESIKETNAQESRQLLNSIARDYLELGLYSDPPRAPFDKSFTIADAGALSSVINERGLERLVDRKRGIVTSRTVVKWAEQNGFEYRPRVEELHGKINPSLQCEFCGQTGSVRVAQGSVTEQYRSAAFVGKALDVGVDVEKSAIHYRCESCRNMWHKKS